LSNIGEVEHGLLLAAWLLGDRRDSSLGFSSKSLVGVRAGPAWIAGRASDRVCNLDVPRAHHPELDAAAGRM